MSAVVFFAFRFVFPETQSMLKTPDARKAFVILLVGQG